MTRIQQFTTAAIRFSIVLAAAALLLAGTKSAHAASSNNILHNCVQSRVEANASDCVVSNNGADVAITIVKNSAALPGASKTSTGMPVVIKRLPGYDWVVVYHYGVMTVGTLGDIEFAN